MKHLRRLLLVVIVFAAVIAFGRYFVSQLGSGGPADGPAGVVLSPPPDVPVDRLGEMPRSEAARRLSAMLAVPGGESRLGLHFLPGDGRELYWIADRSTPEEPLLIERGSGPGGTRLESRWRGSIEDRLAWAQLNDSLEAPHLPAGEKKNLYH